MPLTRAEITAASRVMLPTYCVFFTLLGLTYLLTPADRLLASPGIRYANTLLPLVGWGSLYIAAGIVMAAALIRRHRDWFRAALLFCALLMGAFSIVLFAAAVNGLGSFAAWSWPAFIVAACVASYRSLTVRET